MKTKNNVKALFSAAIVLLSASSLAAQNKGDLTVTVSGLRNSNGKVMVALTEQEIPAGMNFIAADMIQADSAGMKLHFKDVPEMKVYVQIFHDENGNFQLDTTPEGQLKEGVGITPGSAARPSVEIIEGENKINVSMFYF